MKKIILLITISICATLVIGCTSIEQQPIYAKKYQKSLQNKAINLQDQGVSAAWVAERFAGVMNQFKADDITARVKSHFAPELYFNDTWHTFTNSTELANYLKRTGERVYSIEVLIDDVVISEENAYIRWRMSFMIDEGDSKIESIGMTHLRFDENRQIVLYQDYWDSVEGFYRTLPAIGPILTMIRNSLG